MERAEMTGKSTCRQNVLGRDGDGDERKIFSLREKKCKGGKDRQNAAEYTSEGHHGKKLTCAKEQFESDEGNFST